MRVPASWIVGSAIGWAVARVWVVLFINQNYRYHYGQGDIIWFVAWTGLVTGAIAGVAVGLPYRRLAERASVDTAAFEAARQGKQGSG